MKLFTNLREEEETNVNKKKRRRLVFNFKHQLSVWFRAIVAQTYVGTDSSEYFYRTTAGRE